MPRPIPVGGVGPGSLRATDHVHGATAQMVDAQPGHDGREIRARGADVGVLGLTRPDGQDFTLDNVGLIPFLRDKGQEYAVAAVRPSDLGLTGRLDT